MKKVNIGFEYFWRGFNKEDNYFTRTLRKLYDVEISNNPEFMFFSSFKDDNTLKMPQIEGDFAKIFYTGENCRPEMDKCDWAFSFDYDEELKEPRHMRLPLYKFHGAGEDLIKKSGDAKKIMKERNKFCAYIYSKNSKERVEFFKKLSKYKPIDAPGKSMNNMAPITLSPAIRLINRVERKLTGRSTFGAIFSRHFEDYEKTKVSFLRNYKFTVAFENSSYLGYTTEKIYHPMLANSIPIYWGNELIERDFDTKSFISYHDYNDVDDVVDRVIEIDSDEKKYKKMLNEPWYKGNRPSKYVDDKRIIKRLKEIFG